MGKGNDASCKLCYTIFMTRMTRIPDEITAVLQQHLPDLRQRYGVRNLWLFGSYVRAEQTENNDLVVLVSFDNPRLSLIQFIQLELELSKLLDMKVDLVERKGLKPTIGEYFIEESVAVCKDWTNLHNWSNLVALTTLHPGARCQ
jgi:uncharacterized protein